MAWKPLASEYDECRALWQWAQLTPHVHKNLIKVVNEGKRSQITGARLKAIGMRTGVPDYVLPIKTIKYGSLWIEMKRRNRSAVTDTQLEWISRLQGLGNYACVCYGWEHAAQVILDYLEERL